MKKYAMILLALLFAQQLMADSFYEQLCRFNFNWKKYADRAPVGKARLISAEKDMVAAHLASVLTILRSNPTQQLTPQQYRSRMHLMGLLEGYRAAGRFPINSYIRLHTPVFIDANNTYCAVAYLMQQTGQAAVAQRIAATNNLAWVKDIQDPALPAWQQASGFSLEELKLIQGAYDFYEPEGYLQPNRYEIPQQPTCTTAYFGSSKLRWSLKKADIWCLGEGKNGVLHGRWIQNYSPQLPWIIGFYDKGKRTGQWKEYYQGTIRLCRTEYWENDKLNGIRSRFDRVTGNLIEEILFKDGVAITKTNYDRATGLAWVRQPQVDGTVFTKVLDANGGLLAKGYETVNNPGQLQWFQNIELTALNSMVLRARDIPIRQMPTSSTLAGMRLKGTYGPHSIEERILRLGGANGGAVVGLYNTTPLVTYKKEGTWAYYRQGFANHASAYFRGESKQTLAEQFPLFTKSLSLPYADWIPLQTKSRFDSLLVSYKKDQIQQVLCNGESMFTHLQVDYYPATKSSFIIYNGEQEAPAVIKAIGRRNQAGYKIDTWQYFDEYGRLYKNETFILPRRDEEEETKSVASH